MPLPHLSARLVDFVKYFLSGDECRTPKPLYMMQGEFCASILALWWLMRTSGETFRSSARKRLTPLSVFNVNPRYRPHAFHHRKFSNPKRRTTMKRCMLCLVVLFLCVTSGSAQSHGKQPSSPPKQRPTTNLSQDLIRQFVSDNDEVRRYVQEGNSAMENFEAGLEDLNGDGKPEYWIVTSHPDRSPFCGVSGLCAFWLYRKVGATWELLLSGSGGAGLAKTSTKSYHDIVVSMWGGAFDQWTIKYKFDGRKYQEVKVPARRSRNRRARHKL